MMHRLALVALLLVPAACAMPSHQKADCDPLVEADCAKKATLPRVAYARVGEAFATPDGSCKVIRVQDELRVIRCSGDGAIQGCYEELLSVADYDMRWNEWMPLASGDGVAVSFLTPTDVIVRVPRAARARATR